MTCPAGLLGFPFFYIVRERCVGELMAFKWGKQLGMTSRDFDYPPAIR